MHGIFHYLHYMLCIRRLCGVRYITCTFQMRRGKCLSLQFRYLDYISKFISERRNILYKENIVAVVQFKVEVVNPSIHFPTPGKLQSSEFWDTGICEK